MPAIAIFLGALVSVALTHKPSRPEFKFAPDLCAGAKGIRTPGPTRMRYVRKRRPLCRSPNAPVCDRDRDFESRFLQLGVCCELDFGRRAPMKASMRREPQRGPAISGNGVMCQEDPGCEPGPRGGPLTPSSGGGLRRVRAVRRDTPSPRRIRYRTPSAPASSDRRPLGGHTRSFRACRYPRFCSDSP